MRGLLRLVCLTVSALLGGCDLEEITIVEIEDVVIAEVYVNLYENPAENEIRAFLHKTVGSPTSGIDDLRNVQIVVTRSDGLTLELLEAANEECIDLSEAHEPGVCFLADPVQTVGLRPGNLLAIMITLADGGVLTGAALAPSTFEILGIPSACRLDPDTLLPIHWSSSEGAWAYVNETSIEGLPDALFDEGIRVSEDPLDLLGLSISDQDTTIVFPSEFGVFSRFELDQALAVRLQSGLPRSTVAEVSITAVNGNYVNWARGGNFNPSGQVRVPSLRGDGTGVFGATVNRRFVVIISSQRSGLPACLISDP
jgi:hypothetical protein